jgi:hypothetical protein
MSLNFGVSLKGQTESSFNRPNHLGVLIPGNRELGVKIADLFLLEGWKPSMSMTSSIMSGKR